MSDTPKMSVVSVTVSFETKQSTYSGATAENRFVSFKAEVPTGIDGISLNEAIIQSLDLHLAAAESLMSAELAVGHLKVAAFEERLTKLKTRTTKIKAYFEEEPIG